MENPSSLALSTTDAVMQNHALGFLLTRDSEHDSCSVFSHLLYSPIYYSFFPHFSSPHHLSCSLPLCWASFPACRKDALPALCKWGRTKERHCPNPSLACGCRGRVYTVAGWEGDRHAAVFTDPRCLCKYFVSVAGHEAQGVMLFPSPAASLLIFCLPNLGDTGLGSPSA